MNTRFQHPLAEAPVVDATRMPSGGVGSVSGSIHHGLDALAGFYRDEAQALVVLHHLVDGLGLNAETLVLLGPRDAGWLRFVRKAIQWNRRPHQRDHWRAGPIGTAAVVGAAIGAAIADSGLWSTDITQGLAPDLWLGLPAAMVGAAMGASLTGLLHRQQPQYKSFDRLLRRKLHDGCWVVLVHDLPWTHQARVLDVFSRQGQNWSAVSSAAHG